MDKPISHVVQKLKTLIALVNLLFSNKSDELVSSSIQWIDDYPFSESEIGTEPIGHVKYSDYKGNYRRHCNVSFIHSPSPSFFPCATCLSSCRLVDMRCFII